MTSGKLSCSLFSPGLVVLAAAVLISYCDCARGQSPSPNDLPDAPQVQQTSSLNDLPDAPQAQQTEAALASNPTTTQPQQSTTQQPPAQTQQPASSSSSAQPVQNGPETAEERRARAQRELEAEEKQRMLGVVPMFNVQSNREAAPLTSKEKYQLFFKSSTDWYQFVITAIDGEISLLGDEYPSYGEGVEGFAKYWGAAYADTFDGNLWGNAILTSWWHEDPRYYRMGRGNFFKRAGWAATSTVWCRRDKGTWGPNYANVAGNFIGGAISNLYYPSDQRGVGLTLGRGASVTYEGIVGAEISEFWPDIAKRLFKKHLAKQAAEQNAAMTTKQQPESTPIPPSKPPEQKPQ